MGIATHKLKVWTIRELFTQRDREMKSTKETLRDMDERYRISNIYVIEFPEGGNKGNRKQEKFKIT